MNTDNPCAGIKAAADAFSAMMQWLDQGVSLTKVDDMTQAIRIGICEHCPGKQFIESERRCGVCCCPMDFKTSLKYDPVKSGLAIRKTLVKCPEGYW